MNTNRKFIILSIFIFTLFLSTLNKKEERKPTVISTPATSPSPKVFTNLPPAPSPNYQRVPSSSPYQKIQNELSRFHHPDTRIFIEKREELSPRQHRVRITYVLPNGRRTSFKAILDLKNQTLPRRWGRTIHETSSSHQLVPNGTL